MTVVERSDAGERVGGGEVQIEFRWLGLGGDGSAFRTLNEEWISKYFVLETRDIEILSDPGSWILSRGGKVLLAELEGVVVGCVALVPMGGSIYELSKMAVAPAMRGRGVGRRVLERAIAEARLLGAAGLFLGSNSILANAVHLYESVGFRHVAKEKVPDMRLARADVFMELGL